MATYEDLRKEYIKLAKRADQRLVSLEKLSREEGFNGVKHFAYERAMRDIKTWAGEGARRFNTKAPKTKQQLKAKIADIQAFLESKTSTKRDIVRYYKKRQETVSERYGLSGAWQIMARYYSKNINKKFDAIYGSKTALKAIGQIEANADEIKKQIRQHKKANVDTTGDDVLDDVIEMMLQDNRKELRMIGVL